MPGTTQVQILVLSSQSVPQPIDGSQCLVCQRKAGLCVPGGLVPSQQTANPQAHSYEEYSPLGYPMLMAEHGTEWEPDAHPWVPVECVSAPWLLRVNQEAVRNTGKQRRWLQSGPKGI